MERDNIQISICFICGFTCLFRPFPPKKRVLKHDTMSFSSHSDLSRRSSRDTAKNTKNKEKVTHIKKYMSNSYFYIFRLVARTQRCFSQYTAHR